MQHVRYRRLAAVSLRRPAAECGARMLPAATVLDARTRRVFVANLGSNTVSMLDAASGTVKATVGVANPGALAVAASAGRVFAVSDDVTLAGADQVSVLDAT